MRNGRAGSLAVLVVLVALAGFAPVLGTEKDSRQERIEVRTVSVPVQVTLKGEPMRGLGVADFELYDRGKRQKIDSVEVVDLELLRQATGGPAASTVPVAGRRHILFVFDMSFARPASIQLARREVREWLDTALDPTDLVAVATFSVNRGSRLALGFSTDRKQIDRAVSQLGPPDLSDTAADPLVVSAGAVQDEGSDQTFEKSLEYGFNNVEDNSEVNQARRDIYQGATQRLVDQERRQPINRMAVTFGQLATMMRGVEGRKYVVYLSEGFDSSLVFSDWKLERVLEANTALESGDMWRVDSARRFGSGPTEGAIMSMLEEFRRADCVIHAVDLGKRRNAGPSRTLPAFSESLLLMANETGGELHRDFANIAEALDDMMRTTSLTYVLWFRPEDKGEPGEFHPLKVKVRNVPGKAEVSCREGYHVPRPFAERDPAEARLAISQLLTEGHDGGPLPTSVLATPFRLAPERALVPVLVEIDGLSLAGTRQSGKLTTEIYTYAFDPTGGLADFFTQIVQVDLDRVGTFLRTRGLKFYGELELPPGEYTLRTLVVERGAGLTGLRVQRLEVPSFLDEQAVLAPPLFPEGRGIWLLVREAAIAERAEGSRFPFLAGVEPYLPAAEPSVTGGAAQPIYLTGYNLPADPVVVRATIAGLDGSAVRETELPLAERTRGGPDGAEVLMTRLPTDGLDPGRYRLVLSLAGPDGLAQRTGAVTFDVVASASARLSLDRSAPSAGP